jgi:Tol biopolymer transport system component
MRNKLILTAITAVLALTGANRPHETKLQQAIELLETKGDVPGAIRLFEEAAQSPDRNVAARSLLYLGDCRQKLGNEESRTSYERVVREFGDQREIVAEAQSRLAALGKPAGSTMSTRQVWAGAKVDILGTVSPDGRQLSFVDWDTGDLAVRDLVAGRDRRLTNKGSWTDSDEFAEESTISRDGKQVAYGWFNKDFRYELRLANLSGEPNPRRLFDNEEIDWMAPYDWTPDGKWIAVAIARKDRTAQIGLVSAIDGSLRVLKSVDWRGATKLFFSPDGKHLAYDLPHGEATEQRDVFLLAIDGTREIAVVAHPANDVVMGWAPGGKHLLFASDRTGDMSLWALPVADGKPQGAPELIKTDIGKPWSMGITGSGAMHFGVQSGSRDVQVASLDFNSGQVLSVPANPVQSYIGTNSWPDFSPDGKYLSYTSRRDQGGRVFVLGIRSLETGQTRELRTNLNYLFQLRWMPDGRAFSVQSNDRKGRQGIYRIDAETGETTPILISEPGVYSTTVGWSPDGKKLYYRRGDAVTKEELLLEREVSSGKEREILSRKEFFTAALSPDARYLVFRTQDRPSKSSALMLMPVDGGQAKELLRLKDPETLVNNALEWTPDSKSVVFRKNLSASGEESELWLVPVNGNAPRKLGLNAVNIRQLRIHPDGRRIVYTAGQQKREVWVLENFLPTLRASR